MLWLKPTACDTYTSYQNQVPVLIALLCVWRPLNAPKEVAVDYSWALAISLGDQLGVPHLESGLEPDGLIQDMLSQVVS